MSRWDFSFPSPVNDILQKPGFTLQDLLNEDDIVAEIRNQNDELLKFMGTKDVIRQLITYMVKDPGPDASEAVRMRYPVVAKELLSADVDELNLVLAGDSELLDLLFSFYESNEIHLLLSNLVAAVASSVLQANPTKVLDYLSKDKKWMKNLVRHAESAAVAEFFVKFMNLDVESGINPKTFLIDSGFVELFLDSFNADNAVRHSDVYQFASDLLFSLRWEDPLMQRFASQVALDKMFGFILDNNNKSAQRYVPKLISIILRSLAAEVDDGYDSDEESETKRPDPTASLDLLPVVTTTLLSHIPALIKIVHDNQTKKFVLPDRQTVNTFGPHRIHILEMIDDLIVLNYYNILVKIINDTDLFINLFDLISQFPSNSFCHKVVEKLFVHVLEQTGIDSQITLLKKSNLASRLSETHNKVASSGDVTAPQARINQQFLPFVYAMTSSLLAISEAHPQVTEYLLSVNGWKEFSEWVVKYKEAQAIKPVQTEKDDVDMFHADFDESMESPDSTTYLEGRDRDEDDLDLEDDIDMDSSNDADDYDIDQAEILLTKQEIEAFA